MGDSFEELAIRQEQGLLPQDTDNVGNHQFTMQEVNEMNRRKNIADEEPLIETPESTEPRYVLIKNTVMSYVTALEDSSKKPKHTRDMLRISTFMNNCKDTIGENPKEYFKKHPHLQKEMRIALRCEFDQYADELRNGNLSINRLQDNDASINLERITGELEFMKLCGIIDPVKKFAEEVRNKILDLNVNPSGIGHISTRLSDLYNEPENTGNVKP